MTTSLNPALVEVAVISRPHGVRGELRAVPHNSDSVALERTDSVTVGGVEYKLVRARRVRGAYLIQLEGVGDRDAADRLRGQAVAVPREAIELDEGDVLLADLVGLRVVLVGGGDWGEVARVETGLQDRLVIRDAGVERQIPLVDALVVSIDLEAEVIVIDPPEGIPEEPVR